MSSWVVAKFGGSSVKDGEAMLRCSKILENDPRIKITIISATYNTTNQLEMVARTAESSDEEMLTKVISELESKHHNIAKELFSSNQVYDDMNVLFAELKEIAKDITELKQTTPKIMDQLYSLGERLSSVIFADLLKLRIPNRKIVFLDARRIIKTNSEYRKAEPQINLIRENVEEHLTTILGDEKTLIVTQGFIGSDLLGHTTTLGREGSDYSAALFGEAINASLIQIWTDVEGVASSDPRFVKNTRYIKEMSYEEAAALANLGAKVLFPRTIQPAERKGIPVFVGSSLNPDSVGTMIKYSYDKTPELRAVTVKNQDENLLLSYVGNRLDLKPELVESLKEKLKEKMTVVSVHDYSSVSITYKVSNIDSKLALELSHEILLASNK